jgi:hypothetical protein
MSQTLHSEGKWEKRGVMKTDFAKGMFMLLFLLTLVSCGLQTEDDSDTKTVNLGNCSFNFPSDWTVTHNEDNNYTVTDPAADKSFTVTYERHTLPITDPKFEYQIIRKLDNPSQTVERTSRSSYHGYPSFMCFATSQISGSTKRVTLQLIAFNVGQESYVVGFCADKETPMGDGDLLDISDSFTIKHH